MTLTGRDKTTGALTFAGDLDIDAATALRDALWEGFRTGPEVLADLSAVDACDASALQVLLAASSGGKLRFNALSPAVTETAAALGFSLDGPAVSATEGSLHATTELG